MKHKYKINIDQPLPSEENIAAHKDFGRILADYHNLTQPIYRKPLYKNPKAFIGLVFILTVAFLVFWAVEKEEKDKEKEAEMKELPAEIKLAEANSFMKPPTPALAVPPIALEIDARKQQKIALPNGTLLDIPANAFVRADGEQVSGMVQLKVRTITSLAEIIAMGLPMQLEGGLLQGQAIVEVDATSAHPEGPQQLVLASGQKIGVEIPVSDDAAPARIFQLDPTKHLWIGESAKVGVVVKPQHVASVHPDDGFGVVEYDENGQVIPTRKPESNHEGKPQIKVLQFPMDKLGVVCIGNDMPEKGKVGISYRVRFTDTAQQPLRMLTLYAINHSANTVKFHWPKSADFQFDIDVATGAHTDYLGFLSDGRLAIARNVVAMPSTPDVHIIPMTVSEAPIQNLQELTQLIDQK